MSKAKNKITFEFDDEQDAITVIKLLESKYIEITWNNDTKKAMIKVFVKEMKVLVSKSIDQIPPAFRI